MYAPVIMLALMISGISTTTTSTTPPASPVLDLVLKTLVKTFQMPISLTEVDSKFSLEIMLANDVFTLDDALRLFIQQFILALYDGNYHHLPDDWETRYPAYTKIIDEINNILDLVDKQTLSKISMKDIRPLIESLTPTAFMDLQRLLHTLQDEAKKEATSKEEL